MRIRKLGMALLMTVGLMGIAGLVYGCGGLSGNVAATVNGTEITTDDVARRVDKLRMVYGVMIPESEEGVKFTDFQKETTEQLVKEELLRQEAAKKGYTVSDLEIDVRMQELADENFLGDVDRMKQDYYDKGLTEEDLHSDIEHQMLTEKLQQNVADGIAVTDEDLVAFYDKNRTQFEQPERRQARQLVTRDEATAREAATRARAGENFVGLVEAYSVDPDVSSTKGALGIVAPGTPPPEIDSVLQSLGTNQISDPVKVGDLWYVLMVEMVLPAFSEPFDTVKADIAQIYFNQQYSERWRNYTNEVLAAADVEYNDDYNPANRESSANQMTQ